MKIEDFVLNSLKEFRSYSLQVGLLTEDFEVNDAIKENYVSIQEHFNKLKHEPETTALICNVEVEVFIQRINDNWIVFTDKEPFDLKPDFISGPVIITDSSVILVLAILSLYGELPELITGTEDEVNEKVIEHLVTYDASIKI